jgi:hypothetical protein
MNIQDFNKSTKYFIAIFRPSCLSPRLNYVRDLNTPGCSTPGCRTPGCSDASVVHQIVVRQIVVRQIVVRQIVVHQVVVGQFWTENAFKILSHKETLTR